MLLCFNIGLKHGSDGDFSVLSNGLLPEVHLRMSYMSEQLPSHILIIDSR
jgi:hypothetical protein